MQGVSLTAPRGCLSFSAGGLPAWEQEKQVAQQQPVRLDEAWGRIVARAWADEQLKQRLLCDPAAVLREYGVEVPDGAVVKVSRLSNELDRVARIMSLLWLDGQI